MDTENNRYKDITTDEDRAYRRAVTKTPEPNSRAIDQRRALINAERCVKTHYSTAESIDAVLRDLIYWCRKNDLDAEALFDRALQYAIDLEGEE